MASERIHRERRLHHHLLLRDVTAYVLTKSLHSNGSTRHMYRDSPSIVACGSYLATAFSLAPQFLL
jgi:hypothetical protein